MLSGTIYGLKVEQVPADPSNYDAGGGTKNLFIVHDIEGSAASAIGKFQTPNVGGSTNYVIDDAQARIVQMMSENDTAWGCGNLAHNRRSEQVECPGYANQPYPHIVVDMAAKLAADFCYRRGVTPVKLSRADVFAGKAGICGHEDVPDPDNPNLGGGRDHHTDPGSTWPWDEFITLTKSYLATGGSGSQPSDPFRNTHRTGFNVDRRFVRFWQVGGLAVFGYPISRAFVASNGLTVQYFERARLELQRDGSITRGLVGAELVRALGAGAVANGDAKAFVREF